MTHPTAGPLRAGPPDVAPKALLADLTPEQAAAVTHATGPLLIVAGPGTGKTRTLTHRIAHLLASDRALPREILALTFSVRAAGELRLRLAELLGRDAACGVLAATFHSVCARLLREHATLFGRTDAYTIYDQADVRRVIEALLSDRRWRAVHSAVAACGQPSAAELETEIALAKSRLLDPPAYERSSPYPAAPVAGAVWRAVDEELERCDAFGFEDLLVFAVRVLREHPQRLAHLRARFRWLLVDEMQDTNEAQATLVHLLAGPEGNLTVVGDDDQAIYRFRSAQPRNILAFGERYPNHARIVLGRNFRSRAEILTAAACCIAINELRHPKRLVAVRGGGGRISTRALATDPDQAGRGAAPIAHPPGPRPPPRPGRRPGPSPLAARPA